MVLGFGMKKNSGGGCMNKKFRDWYYCILASGTKLNLLYENEVLILLGWGIKYKWNNIRNGWVKK
jgi:hypothetical protein